MRSHRYITRTLIALVIVSFLLSAAQDRLARYSDAGLDRPATELLDDLTVTPEHDGAGYDRARFGDGWATGTNGCDTRAQVLIDESTIPAVVDHSQGCHVITGRWISVYDAVETTDPAGLDIDHLVPLAEAWASGADTWTTTRRRAYANDVDRPGALIAVTQASNRAKSDNDPAQWMPTNPAQACWYATAWITQKAAWDLTIDQAEHDTLARILAGCPDTSAQPTRGGNP